MLIDTHCHLDAAEFAADRAAVIDRARAAGVAGFVVPGVTAAGFDGLDELADATPGMARAFGLHPLYIDCARQADLDLLAARLEREDVVAVGEIGLDGFVPTPTLETQLPWFEAQLALARRAGLPVILHVRRAVDAITAAVRRAGVAGGIAHAFNGSEQQARQLAALGFKFGFGGTLTYPGSRRIRALAQALPLEWIVLETDAPDIAPVWARGQRNEPATVARIAQELAELRGLSVEAVIEATGRNALAVLPRLGAVLAAA
ncbi:TatD family hydrolase [Nitrogeniibacter mangrovi]|uniref:TatD family hydrolase n=1 Tax=Nitrogeniibacter mangrovi TaxID=2016596 RepID=A0A6C1B2B2_9RHOO|nr:TatD family hydrolase [Nitrogeniibacter mangrovi]QID17513.1 TatD family hydrolase [Nitrogeniibacter mangrovi]